MKPLHESKTMWFAAVVSLAGAAQVLLPELQSVLSPKEYAWATFITGMVIAALRAVTDTAVKLPGDDSVE